MCSIYTKIKSFTIDQENNDDDDDEIRVSTKSTYMKVLRLDLYVNFFFGVGANKHFSLSFLKSIKKRKPV